MPDLVTQHACHVLIEPKVYCVCYSVNTQSGRKTLTSVVHVQALDRFRRVVRKNDLSLWAQIRETALS